MVKTFPKWFGNVLPKRFGKKSSDNVLAKLYQNVWNSKEIEKIPTRSINSIAQTQAGVTTADDGGAINLRGARSDATQYWINGVKLLPGQTPTVPIEAISEVSILTGGIPAQWGDAVGGIMVGGGYVAV